MATEESNPMEVSAAAPWAERRLLTIRDLQRLFQCGRTAAYARVHEDDFPAPLALSDSAHRWWEHEVLDWVERHRVIQQNRARRRTRALANPTNPVSLASPESPSSVASRGDEPRGTARGEVAPRPVEIHRRDRAS